MPAAAILLLSSSMEAAPISANPYQEITARPRRAAMQEKTMATIPLGVKLKHAVSRDLSQRFELKEKLTPLAMG